ncbi:FkbM family methyltransferase [Chloroflexota bacterium]
MWKSHILKSAYRLMACLNATGVGKFRFLRGLKRIGKYVMIRLFSQNNVFLTEVYGFPMYIYPNTAETYAYLARHYEPYTTELFESTIRPGATVLDIGAQFGYFSLIAAKHAGREGRVYAFEPVPANFELLCRNIQMNGYTNTIQSVQKAVGDKHTVVRLFVYEHSDSHSIYRHPQARVKGTISVECVTIDEFLGGRPADVIKMDIEGNEPYALAGMKQTISKSDNLILLIEFAPAYVRRAGVEPNDYLEQLANIGFNIQIIDENLRCLKPVTQDFVPNDEPSWYVNLYCTRENTVLKS